MPVTQTDHTGLRRGMTFSFPSGPYSANGVAPSAANRIELSSGTQPAAETHHAHEYTSDAFVPRTPWRPPSCHERGILYGTPTPAADPGDWISIIQAPAHLLTTFTDLRSAAAEGNDQALNALLNGRTGRTALIEAIRWSMTLTDPTRAGIDAPLLYGKTPTGSPTLTTGDHSQKVGLHVDSWYHSPLKTRATAPNRLAINLGHHPRYLLCINTPLASMSQTLHAHNLLTGTEDPHYTLGQAFLTAFPHYPVTKITLHPGEAYLAPTENMLHDGYAEPHGQIDLQFSCRGHFPAPTTLA
ncbi:hypothetical protein [Nocardia sp. NBC_00511]|uniref:hypothetical protein n=1 Tax=Nocardia sp. NBC_00511 TaxID=2903591 RepID=UPI0030E1FCE8